MKQNRKAVVLGGGAWGTALACMIARNHDSVKLWARDSALCDEINDNQRNSKYLKDIELASGIRASSKLQNVVENTDIILLVTPAQATA